MFEVDVIFDVVHKNISKTLIRRITLPCLPTNGTHIAFDTEEGVSKVEEVYLDIKDGIGAYTLQLDTIDLTEDYESIDEAISIFINRGWKQA